MLHVRWWTRLWSGLLEGDVLDSMPLPSAHFCDTLSQPQIAPGTLQYGPLSVACVIAREQNKGDID